MTDLIRQHFFTSWNNNGDIGYATRAMSPGIPPDVLQEVLSFIEYSIPSGMSRDDIAQHPVALRYGLFKDYALLTHVASSGKDESRSDDQGRKGNFFAHTLIASPESFVSFNYPASFWPSEWRTAWSDDMQYAPQDNLDGIFSQNTPTLSDTDILGFIRSDAHRSQLLVQLLSAVLRYTETKRRIVIIDTPDVVARWIAAVSLALPGRYRASLTFSTYSSKAYQDRFLITGVAPGTVLNSALDRANLIMLDPAAAASGKLAGVLESAYAPSAVEYLLSGDSPSGLHRLPNVHTSLNRRAAAIPAPLDEIDTFYQMLQLTGDQTQPFAPTDVETIRTTLGRYIDRYIRKNDAIDDLTREQIAVFRQRAALTSGSGNLSNATDFFDKLLDLEIRFQSPEIVRSYIEIALEQFYQGQPALGGYLLRQVSQRFHRENYAMASSVWLSYDYAANPQALALLMLALVGDQVQAELATHLLRIATNLQPSPKTATDLYTALISLAARDPLRLFSVIATQHPRAEWLEEVYLQLHDQLKASEDRREFRSRFENRLEHPERMLRLMFERDLQRVPPDKWVAYFQQELTTSATELPSASRQHKVEALVALGQEKLGSEVAAIYNTCFWQPALYVSLSSQLQIKISESVIPRYITQDFPAKQRESYRSFFLSLQGKLASMKSPLTLDFGMLQILDGPDQIAQNGMLLASPPFGQTEARRLHEWVNLLQEPDYELVLQAHLKSFFTETIQRWPEPYAVHARMIYAYMHGSQLLAPLFWREYNHHFGAAFDARNDRTVLFCCEVLLGNHSIPKQIFDENPVIQVQIHQEFLRVVVDKFVAGQRGQQRRFIEHLESRGAESLWLQKVTLGIRARLPKKKS